ncbi:NAD-dependent epimerase/dehydratase family protein [Streptomyces sp. NPDC057580]|uniref:NAD-dependent epimerase/dehydratase family protein n=1 Tax=Streptomyces sp. NPDC057580 TaxID=3346173 RepID=UPI0036770D4E
MRTLVIGGTGLIGVHTCLELAERGHRVVVAGRRRPDESSLVATLPFMPGDYANGDFDTAALSGFEAIVFTAGSDVRHVRPEDEGTEYWARHHSAGVPALALAARDAGVQRFVQVGSCYHMVRPDLIDTDPYVRARRDADEGVRALADAGFAATTVNPPPIVGMIPGASARRFARLVRWARGEHDDRFPPLVAPPGGTNYLTVRSLAEAIAGALERGVPGTAYLVGDQNLSYAEYFQLLVDIAGGSGRVRVHDAEHSFLPDRMIVPGRGTLLRYEPPAEQTALLGYRRDDVAAMLTEMVAAS